METKTKITIAIGLLLAIATAVYFNRDIIYVTNTPPQVKEKTPVAVEMTPEQMIAKVLHQVEIDSVKHMENVNTFNEYAEYMSAEVDRMHTELNNLAEVASTSNEKLNTSTRAYQTLREQFNF